MPGTLFVVATPIGNLEDITVRALRVLREVQIVAAEDTRVTRKLLSHFDIHTTLRSLHEHSKANRVEEVLVRLRAGDNVALVSDAGTPGISDPGAVLVRAARNEGIPISPIPGASAVAAAISILGNRDGRFVFDGFPPRTHSDRHIFFQNLCKEPRSIVLLESPRRLLATLKDLHSHLGDRKVLIGRELTKRFEEVWTGNISAALNYFGTYEPRGEIILVVEGMSSIKEESVTTSDVMTELLNSIKGGLSRRDAVDLVSSKLKLSRKQVYAASLLIVDEQTLDKPL